MQYISRRKFADSGINTSEEILFVSLWAELFNPNTVDTYRVRVMNSRSILHELEQVITDRISEQTDMRNVQFICEEAVRLLTNDLVCRIHFKNKMEFVVNCLKKARHEAKTSLDLHSLSAKAQVLRSDLDAGYLTLLGRELEKAIFEIPAPEVIVSATNALATELVWRGFSLQYLYRRILYFLDVEQGKTFRERWNQFLLDVNQPSREFRVVLKFTGPADLGLIGKVVDIQIDAEFTRVFSSPQEVDFGKLPGTFVGTIANLYATDPFSAAYKSFYKFSLLLDLTRFEYRKSEILLTPKVLVYDDIRRNTFLIDPNPRPIGFQSSGNIDRFRKHITSFEQVFDREKKLLDGLSQEMLLNSFRYFRMSLESTVPESRFLHCWIALEFLLKTGSSSSIIGPIVQFVPKVLALQYMKKLLKDLSANFSRCRVRKDELKAAGISEISGSIFNLDELLQALTEENRLQILLAACRNPLLEQRVRDVASVFSSPENIRTRLIHHLEDLKWHLQRMYRVRNRIVHSASIGMDLTQLESNLSYYFTTVFNNLIYVAKNSAAPSTIEEIFMKQDAAFDYLYESLHAPTFRAHDLLGPHISGLSSD
jgi:hypothetical protein